MLLLDALWRSTEYERVPRLPGPSWSVACSQSQGRRVRHARRNGAELRDSRRLRSSLVRTIFIPTCPRDTRFSQYDKPLAEHGFIEIETNTGRAGTPVAPKRIGITRVHLEEDAGKSLHEGFVGAGETTAIDLNRSGVPLIEIVSEPDIASPDEAYEYLTRLKEIILYTGVSDVNMEEGSLRCDANVDAAA